MAKTKTLVSHIKALPKPKTKCWTDVLSPKLLQEVYEVRREYHAGRITASAQAIGRELLKTLPVACSVDHIARWLREKP